MDCTGIMLLLRQGELVSIGQSEKSHGFLGSRREDLLFEHGAEGDPLGTCSETGKAQMLVPQKHHVRRRKWSSCWEWGQLIGLRMRDARGQKVCGAEGKSGV